MREIIDSMDMFTDKELSNDLEGLMDVPVWDKLLLVKPQSVLDDKSVHALMSEDNELCNLEGIMDLIFLDCFMYHPEKPL